MKSVWLCRHKLKWFYFVVETHSFKELKTELFRCRTFFTNSFLIVLQTFFANFLVSLSGRFYSTIAENAIYLHSTLKGGD